jgi:hypothetical protein
VHGSPAQFKQFRQPDLAHGGLIFFSKLLGDARTSTALQAEHYGDNLYLCKLDKGTSFEPYTDARAKDIMRTVLVDVWEYERKLKWGRVDYQDLHLIVPPAIKLGYNRFRVFEQAISGDSHAVAYPKMVHIVDTFWP